MKKGVLTAVGGLALALAGWFWWSGRSMETVVSPALDAGAERPAASSIESADESGAVEATGESAEEVADAAETDDAAETSEDESSDEPMTEEERQEAEEERRVTAFDDLTDKWLEADDKRPVTMKDADEFVARFKAVPDARKDECIHRALNLVPDENVMLLAGVLMDRTIDKEIVETVYNDILNRDEDVKRPILQQIFKDKTHPCWTDTAWILDVTDDLPKK